MSKSFLVNVTVPSQEIVQNMLHENTFKITILNAILNSLSEIPNIINEIHSRSYQHLVKLVNKLVYLNHNFNYALTKAKERHELRPCNIVCWVTIKGDWIFVSVNGIELSESIYYGGDKQYSNNFYKNNKYIMNYFMKLDFLEFNTALSNTMIDALEKFNKIKELNKYTNFVSIVVDDKEVSVQLVLSNINLVAFNNNGFMCKFNITNLIEREKFLNTKFKFYINTIEV